MKPLVTAAILSLATLLAAQACLAEESAAFSAHQAQLQTPASSAQQQAQRVVDADHRQG